MSTAYGFPNCVGWYAADLGVYADAGVTAAADQGPVAQWNDLSGSGHHLTQPTVANRPVFNAYAAGTTAAGPATLAPYGTAVAVAQPSYARSVLFDGTASFLTLPAGVAVPATGCTVVTCTRGPGVAPVSLGTDGTRGLAYGWFATPAPGRMGVYAPATGVHPFPDPTVLPMHQPIVHGFRCSSALAETRLYVGTNQQSALPANYGNAALAGGAVGRAAGVSDPTYGTLAFTGEVFELLVFASPLTDAMMATLLADVQAANRLRADANAHQAVFVGDSLTTGGTGAQPVSHGYPWHLCQHYGGTVKPVVVATPGHSVAQQQAMVSQHVVPLDRTPFGASAAVVCCGGTDVWAGGSAADAAAAVAGLCSSLRSAGFKVAAVTVTPRAAGTTAQQVTLSTAVANLNAAIRSNWSAYADALVDWAADARLSDYANATYFAADGWHTTDAGDGVKAQLVKAALDPLLSPPAAAAVVPLTYSAAVAGGRSFAGTYGNFPRA